MIKTVIRFQNNMVMTFDKQGEQIPDYQGRYEEVKDKILENAFMDTVFFHSFPGSNKLEEVSLDKW